MREEKENFFVLLLKRNNKYQIDTPSIPRFVFIGQWVNSSIMVEEEEKSKRNHLISK
jgi:hypothetical protein